MSGRYVNGDKTPNGYNGKRNTNEVYGVGNFEDYGMRGLDNRLMKFWGVDPLTKKYPYYSPYQFAGNTPIMASDLDGAEPDVKIKSWSSKYTSELRVEADVEIKLRIGILDMTSKGVNSDALIQRLNRKANEISKYQLGGMSFNRMSYLPDGKKIATSSGQAGVTSGGYLKVKVEFFKINKVQGNTPRETIMKSFTSSPYLPAAMLLTDHLYDKVMGSSSEAWGLSRPDYISLIRSDANNSTYFHEPGHWFNLGEMYNSTDNTPGPDRDNLMNSLDGYMLNPEQIGIMINSILDDYGKGKATGKQKISNSQKAKTAADEYEKNTTP